MQISLILPELEHNEKKIVRMECKIKVLRKCFLKMQYMLAHKHSTFEFYDILSS